MPTTAALHPYQVPHARKILAALRRGGSALDASDTGTGKMYVAIAVAGALGAVPLVIAPKSTLPEWQKVSYAFGVPIEAVGYEKVRGTRKKILAPPPICAANQREHCGPFLARVADSEWGHEVRMSKGSAWRWRWPFRMIIFDEVHRCGGMTSLNSKLLIAAKRQAEFVLCCSATAADDPRQLKALGYTLGLFDHMKGFRWWLLRNGCEPGTFGGFDLSEDPEAVREAMAKIGHSIFEGGKGARMRKAEIPGFPETLIRTKLIPAETGAFALVERLREEFKAGNHLAQLTAIRQQLELLRVDALAELAEDYAQSSRVIIFVNYTETIRALRKALFASFGSVAAIDGSNSVAERERIKTAWQADEMRVLICNNQAGGEGIGLHGTKQPNPDERTCLISPCYSARQMKQVLGRAPRQGGAFSQQFFTYFADTPEAQIAAAVEQKLGNLDALNDSTLNGVLD